MSNARSYGENGPNPISFSEIVAWSSATWTLIKPEEVAIIRDMDHAYCEALNKEHATQRQREGNK